MCELEQRAPADLLAKGHKFYIVTIKLGRFSTLDYIDQFYQLLAEADEDEEYGFSIILPEGWEDYELERYEEDEFPEVAEWYFYLPSEEGEFLMFAISIYNLDSEFEDFTGQEVIAQDDLYRYTWVEVDEVPDELEDRVADFDQIRQSFTLK